MSFEEAFRSPDSSTESKGIWQYMLFGPKTPVLTEQQILQSMTAALPHRQGSTPWACVLASSAKEVYENTLVNYDGATMISPTRLSAVVHQVSVNPRESASSLKIPVLIPISASHSRMRFLNPPKERKTSPSQLRAGRQKLIESSTWRARQWNVVSYSMHCSAGNIFNFHSYNRAILPLTYNYW